MLIAHIPAGYLTSCGLLACLGCPPRRQRALLATGLVCSVLPDLDLFYFYLVDARQHVHQTYWFHIPTFWIAVYLAALPVCVAFPALRSYYAVSGANIFVHLVLDSVSASVFWLYPLSDSSFGLVTVPATYSWWVLNFLFHWTFALELTLLAGAGFLFAARRSRVGGRSGRRDHGGPPG